MSRGTKSCVCRCVCVCMCVSVSVSVGGGSGRELRMGKEMKCLKI